ncbi:hypothetical protein T05_4616 [Trichinella murrelli]|uniref:Uncharacterized protein n=1 Tax=Trichinella murrelli TaxID=144512 RepID=A0A0V0TG12_9BILA|nr:hypothetical protein T05_4616 [Trichinella murrelli]
MDRGRRMKGYIKRDVINRCVVNSRDETETGTDAETEGSKERIKEYTEEEGKQLKAAISTPSSCNHWQQRSAKNKYCMQGRKHRNNFMQ